jgi:hypothetical protein
MKPSKLLCWTVLAVVVVLAIPAIAQVRETKFNIPFNFNIGKEVRPAGPYVISSVFESSLLIRHTDGSGAIVVSSMAVESSDRSAPAKLVFHRYGDKYFLSQTWLGRSIGRELFRSGEEKEMARITEAQDQIIVAEK